MHLEQILLLTDNEDLAFFYEMLLGHYEDSKVVLLSKQRDLQMLTLVLTFLSLQI